jgi:PAS domain S-box-containing protein
MQAQLANDTWVSTNLLDAVFDHLSDAIVFYDNHHKIIGVNHAAIKLFGLAKEEMIGHDCSEVFRCGVCEPGCGILVSLNQPQPNHSSTIRIHTDNGRERLAVIRTSPITDREGRMLGSVATVRDVTAVVEPNRREIVSESPVMIDLMNFVRRIASSEAATILLEGENGTGKDVIAKTIHYESMRRAEPFIAINCAAIPDTLLESELFGYERGAFTDARSQKRGIFELADKGTLFLDEIAEIPIMLQAKLLRVLEEQTFRRLGGLKDINLDLRVIAATNRDLRDAVRTGAFRQDLYFRLNVIQLTIPPLRERPEDILPLAHFFIEAYNRKFKRDIEGLTPEAARLFMAYSWPGNVRELRNAIERGMILEETPQINAKNLPFSLATGALSASVPAQEIRQQPQPAFELGISLEENEMRLIRQALEKTGGNQTQAARVLKITRDTLRYKMKKYALQS